MDFTILSDRHRLGYFNVHETAKLLNINYQTVRENIRRGDIPEPTLLIGRRRYFTAAEVERIATIFSSRRRYAPYSSGECGLDHGNQG
jgi:excisionase family DNA binding protein